jgi:hypothetical protein
MSSHDPYLRIGARRLTFRSITVGKPYLGKANLNRWKPLDLYYVKERGIAMTDCPSQSWSTNAGN